MVSKLYGRGSIVSLASVPAFVVLFALSFTLPAKALATDEVILDEPALVHLEQQAASAQFREQCFLYTELLHNLTEIAGKQLADGQDEQAAATFRHIDLVVGKVQVTLGKDAKRLKNAEMILEHATHRLTDMLHITAGDQHVALQATVGKVNALQSLLLSQVFAK